METRRDFLKNAAFLTGATMWTSVPDSILRALEIDPQTGSTFLDAEHVVILMQENRSFDHSYGALKGVRGYRDPRVHIKPDGLPVWFQADSKGELYAPFRLDMKGSNVTWVGGLPHSWPDQVDARNGGKYDKWLIAKSRKDLPFTLGHYTREDLPFYYSLADAFTVCDQAFCSSLTGTTPNRLFLWTGNIRKASSDAARVQNGDTDYDKEAQWTTYPERLEDAGVSWRIYQNEISLDTGLVGEEDAWLSNFTDNPIEWFSQFNVRFSKSRRAYISNLISTLPDAINAKEQLVAASAGDEKVKLNRDLDKLQNQLSEAQTEQKNFNDETWNALSSRAKALHEKAFTNNEADPNFRTLEKLTYQDVDKERTTMVPKGDVLHNFRRDVDQGKLPAVSWIVAPEHFSDHPGSAWYGAWYVSECLNILTKNPEVWKKTIFILCYDENDGYYDHIPPFIAPHPGRPETGKVSEGIDTAIDVSNNHRRDHSIGLGYRCPMVIASPWSRGGCVNSEVFDHTSVIQLIETWLSGKGKNVKESNISEWRRTVCGDLSSTFRPYKGEKYDFPKPLDRNEVIKAIDRAKYLQPTVKLSPIDRSKIASVHVGASQESGTRPSCPLSYELEANGVWKGGHIVIKMEARNRKFGKNALGAPFNVYSYGPEMKSRAYAVRSGDVLTDLIPIEPEYNVRIDGPNGFMRQFTGNLDSPKVDIAVEAKGDRIQVALQSHEGQSLAFDLADESYGSAPIRKSLAANSKTALTIETKATSGWYDFSIKVGSLSYRYAGRVEVGKWSISDPAMG